MLTRMKHHATSVHTPKHHTPRWPVHLVAALLVLVVAACGNSRKTYVIGVSQCSEDVWREKLNEELRIAALYYNNVDLRISTAYDDVRLQTEQIDRFVDDKVDLLVVAPGQVSISPAIDRAYERGIPVIIFDRRTRSDKYTAYIGADNRAIGSTMASYLATALKGRGRIVEVCGLPTSSPAIGRAQGFDSIVAASQTLTLAAQIHADWTEQGAYRVMDSLLSHPHPDFDCVFAHNDRMAMGARRAATRHGLDVRKIRFCGVDAMPRNGGGMQLVADGTLMASYIYPTRGDEVMRLAMNILRGKHYNRENNLSSALVTRDNARVLLMQNEETERQQDHLATLRSRVDKAAADFNTQRVYLVVLLVVVILLFTACAIAVSAYRTKTRYNRRLRQSIDEQQRMTLDMEAMTRTQLQFFTNVSHELRTPLTLIAGPAEQLLADPSLRTDQRNMLEMVARNTRILIRMVGEILDFRKVQNDKEHLTLNRFSLKEELETWAADFRAAAARQGITILVDTAGVPADARIIADRDKLAHVYFNLMSNALKYTPRQGTVTVGLALAGHRYTLTVADTGRGIAAEDLPHLFERFYQAKGAIGGTGIGLALVRAYVDMHQGDIHAASTPGQGATFTVTLPDSQPGYDPSADLPAVPQPARTLVDDSYIPVDAAGQATERITDAEEFDADKPLILVIDDNNNMRAYLRSVLAPHYNVSEAADGKTGLEMARREVPKLVISDVMMPVMDGLEFTRQLKADTATSHIPVILLTARSLSQQREEGYHEGADSYIAKPFPASLLLARVDNLLRSRVHLQSIFAGDNVEKEAEEQLSATDRTFVGRLRDTVRQNLGDSDFSVERLGAELGLSRVQLYRKVKALTGHSPVELLRKARLAKARRLVETTDLSVAEIAYEVGFASPSYFNKCFKDEYGVNPGKMGGRETASK